jgi:exosortase D (VPLPA-CTERM-specific)
VIQQVQPEQVQIKQVQPVHVPTESSTVRPPSAILKTIPLWQMGILAAISLWLYWPTVFHLVGQWWHDPNFQHGFIVPFFSALVIWQERDRLARILPHPSWSGLLVLLAGLGVLIVGRMGAEIFLDRSSMLLVVAGVVILFAGWNLFRAVLFPWACLLLMIPVPAILFNQITFPLQLLVSRVSAEVLRWVGVPLVLEGNILKLATLPLDVAEACSGIRSLTSLLTLSIIYGYLLEKRLWVRWFLALASVPIAIAANCVRIIGTGLLVQHGYPDAAQGAYHETWGVIVFILALLMVYALHALICSLFSEKGGKLFTASTPTASVFAGVRSSATSFILATLLIAASAVFLQVYAGSEVFPPRLELRQFPTQFSNWIDEDVAIDQDVLAILRPSDYLLRSYRTPQETQDINLFIPFYRSQRAGEAPHSPQNCLPGAGWTPVENQRITLITPGHEPFPANRYLVTDGDSRQLVIYWFWAHGRGVASEFWAKYYLVRDSIKMHRSDGALVRVATMMNPDETVDAAQQRLLPFIDRVVPLLDGYIPR